MPHPSSSRYLPTAVGIFCPLAGILSLCHRQKALLLPIPHPQMQYLGFGAGGILLLPQQLPALD